MALLSNLGRYDEALAHRTEQIDIYEQHYCESSAEFVAALVQVGSLRGSCGDDGGAMEFYVRTAASFERLDLQDSLRYAY